MSEHSPTCLYANGQSAEPDRAVCPACAEMPASVPAGPPSPPTIVCNGGCDVCRAYADELGVSFVVPDAARAPDAGLRAKVEALPGVKYAGKPRDPGVVERAAVRALLDAALASPAPAGLDVERLARAMSDHEDAQFAAFGEGHDCDFGCAADIAEVYAFDRGRAATRPAEDAGA